MKRSVAVALVVWLAPLQTRPAPQRNHAAGQAGLATVLASVASGLAQYETASASVVAEEDYLQQFRAPLGVGMNATPARALTRRLKSDVLVLTDPSYGCFTLRDVFEVDGRSISDRDQRLERLFLTPTADVRQQAEAIANESARFNLNVSGVSMNRSINDPMAASLFLRAQSQHRSTFAIDREETSDGGPAVVLSFVEQAWPRLVRSPDNVPMRGSAWIEASSGRVARTTLSFALGTAETHTAVSIDVKYGEEPRNKRWVPISMDEQYIATRRGVFELPQVHRGRYATTRSCRSVCAAVRRASSSSAGEAEDRGPDSADVSGVPPDPQRHWQVVAHTGAALDPISQTASLA